MLLFIFIFLFTLYSYALYYLHKQSKKNKEKLSWWPVQHRLDFKNRLQYSVDGKTWTYIMGFEDEHDYGTYKGPGFNYIVLKPSELLEWRNMLYTVQKCHEWNTAALNHYREAIEKYLETK